jgi:hypothetical protein
LKPHHLALPEGKSQFKEEEREGKCLGKELGSDRGSIIYLTLPDGCAEIFLVRRKGKELGFFSSGS